MKRFDIKMLPRLTRLVRPIYLNRRRFKVIDTMAMKYEDLPPQIQNQLQQLQQFQQQLQLTAQQHLQLESQIKENANALEELDKTEKDAQVYQSVGSILIKKKSDKVMQDLQERSESLKVRKTSVEKQEQRLREKVEEIQNKIQGALSPQAG